MIDGISALTDSTANAASCMKDGRMISATVTPRILGQRTDCGLRIIELALNASYFAMGKVPNLLE